MVLQTSVTELQIGVKLWRVMKKKISFFTVSEWKIETDSLKCMPLVLTLRPSECFGLGLRLGLGLGAGLGPWCTACWCWWCCLWLLPADFFSWCLSECKRAVILAGRDGPRHRSQHPTWLAGLDGWGSQHLAAACDGETRLLAPLDPALFPLQLLLATDDDIRRTNHCCTMLSTVSRKRDRWAKVDR